MSTFVITWTSGNQEVVTQADAATVEEFANVHFGSAWEMAQESGVTVEQIPDDQEEDLITHCAERGVLGGVIQPTVEETPGQASDLTTEQVASDLTTEQL